MSVFSKHSSSNGRIWCGANVATLLHIIVGLLGYFLEKMIWCVMVCYGVIWCDMVSHHFNMVSSFLSFSPFKKLACVKKFHCCIETIHMSNMWSFIKFECDPNAENSLHMTSCKNSSHSKISFLAKYVFYFC